MKEISRRRLLAATGASASLSVFGAGCLGERGVADGDGTDDTNDEAGNLTPLEQWVPATGSAELLFHYRDLAAVRRYEDELQPDVIEAVPTLPDGESGDFVEQVADGEPAVDWICRFGSEGVVGNVIVSGAFDPESVDETLEPAAGDFASFERDGVSIAVSSETLVVSPSDGASLEAILAAGVEGTDRRIDSEENFAPVIDRLEESTFVWGEHVRSSEDGAAGNGVAYSWSLGTETATYSVIAAFADSDRLEGFEREFSAADDVTVETDDAVGVATKTVPIEEYAFRDMFAERGSEPPQVYAGVSIETDRKPNAVVVTYQSSGNADTVEVRDEDGVRTELNRVGDTATLEYEEGESGEIIVVAINDETEAVVATHPYSF